MSGSTGRPSPDLNPRPLRPGAVFVTKLLAAQFGINQGIFMRNYGRRLLLPPGGRAVVGDDESERHRDEGDDGGEGVLELAGVPLAVDQDGERGLVGSESED